MSDTDQRRPGLTDASRLRVLMMAFPGLTSDEASEILADLVAGTICFGEDDLRLERPATRDDDVVKKWLLGTGRWQKRLLESITDEARTLRWSVQHHFLYVIANTFRDELGEGRAE
jgi:hypothetical protein